MWTTRKQVYNVTQSGEIIPSRGCMSIAFINAGQTGAWVNGIIPIAPGASLSLSEEHPDMQDMTEYYIKFDESVAPPPAFTGNYVNVGNSLIVIVKHVNR